MGARALTSDQSFCLPCQVVSFFSLKSDSAPPWMVLAVLWCSMAQTLLLPSFIWSCERYRADVRTVWEQCVAIMSEDDGDDGQRRDGDFYFLDSYLYFLSFLLSPALLLEEMCCPGVPPTGLNWSQLQSPHSLIMLSVIPALFLSAPRELSTRPLLLSRGLRCPVWSVPSRLPGKGSSVLMQRECDLKGS